MTALPESFTAFVADHSDGSSVREIRTMTVLDLGAGDVTIRVSWSGVNFKDALASIPNGKVARISPLIPGVDLAGTVVESANPDFQVGARVIAHGYDIGVARHGGYSEYARIPAEWVVPLPDSLTERQAMSLGTAGFTAALSVDALERRGLTPADGPVLVTGATGGVGSVAVGILAARGYEVVASSGKPDAAGWLTKLGAAQVIDRGETAAAAKPLQRERWAGAVDCVGGHTLEYVLSTLRYGAAVAASGNTGGMALSTTVFPFILRGVQLVGIDSVQCPIELRREMWNRLATDLRPNGLDDIGSSTVTLDDLSGALDKALAGAATGRTLVKLSV